MVEKEGPILSVDDLSVSFKTYAGRVQAVRGVSIDLYKGETLAIVGESGSGKSVTTKAILGVLPKNGRIDAGSIAYHGEDLAKFGEKDFHKIRGKKISLVFQDPFSSLNPIMIVGKQIMEALTLSLGMDKNSAKARALELLHAVGIPDPETRFLPIPFSTLPEECASAL